MTIKTDKSAVIQRLQAENEALKAENKDLKRKITILELNNFFNNYDGGTSAVDGDVKESE